MQPETKVRKFRLRRGRKRKSLQSLSTWELQMEKRQQSKRLRQMRNRPWQQLRQRRLWNRLQKKSRKYRQSLRAT